MGGGRLTGLSIRRDGPGVRLTSVCNLGRQFISCEDNEQILSKGLSSISKMGNDDTATAPRLALRIKLGMQ